MAANRRERDRMVLPLAMGNLGLPISGKLGMPCVIGTGLTVVW
ncbi:hypothetical protein OKA05_25640 [Luteolibacter arcticus]|uniref:Uncharacterized protein n=1 Tax=Luteolibacter arcticus TaxID=1581411 RepID=A0ABT3GR81_9BACT|nr:hypothetical protein [Luteolibacter arcticus]MCW1925968.1 hypothetical protein [Luteolibacter arcticus]